MMWPMKCSFDLPRRLCLEKIKRCEFSRELVHVDLMLY